MGSLLPVADGALRVADSALLHQQYTTNLIIVLFLCDGLCDGVCDDGATGGGYAGVAQEIGAHAATISTGGTVDVCLCNFAMEEVVVAAAKDGSGPR